MTIKTTSGPITLERPKLRGADAAFASRLLGKGVTRTHGLEALVIAGYVRGLSTRDVEASLAEALGLRRPYRARRSVLRSYSGRVRGVADPLAGRPGPAVCVRGRLSVPLPRRRPSRASAVRLGDHRRRQAGPAQPGRRQRRVHRRLPGVPTRPGRPRAGRAAAGHHRRRRRADQRGRAGLAGLVAATLPGPSRPQHPGQGRHGRPGSGQGRLLANLRRPARHPRRTRARRGSPTRRGVRPTVGWSLPTGGRLRPGRPRRAHRAPAVSGRALVQDPGIPT